MRFCWADKIAFGIFLAVMGFWLFLGLTSGNVGGPGWWDAFSQIAWLMLLYVFLPIWAVLRFIDLCLGGPARRWGRRPDREPTRLQRALYEGFIAFREARDRRRSY